MEMIRFADEERKNLGLTAWLDRLLGKRHPFRLFFTGFSLGVVVSWATFSLILSPASQKALEVVIQGQQNELADQRDEFRDLSIANRELRDSIQQMNTYGAHYGRLALTKSSQPIAGNEIKGWVHFIKSNQAYLNLTIDTCGFSAHGRRCREINYGVRLNIGCVTPILHGDWSYLLIPREIREDTVIVDVYKPIK